MQPAASSKQDAIREAATRVFLREGYGASMDVVAAEAGVSKQTVYHHFGSKEGLFRAIVEALSEDFLGVLVERERAGDDPATTLGELAHRFLSLLVAPSSLALYRMLVAEAPRFPDLAREFYGAGPGRAVRRLAAWLEEQDRRGRLAVPDPALSAEQFLGALVGHIQLRALLGLPAAPCRSDLRRAAAYAVEGFLRAHRVCSSGRSAPREVARAGAE